MLDDVLCHYCTRSGRVDQDQIGQPINDDADALWGRSGEHARKAAQPASRKHAHPLRRIDRLNAQNERVTPAGHKLSGYLSIAIKGNDGARPVAVGRKLKIGLDGEVRREGSAVEPQLMRVTHSAMMPAGAAPSTVMPRSVRRDLAIERACPGLTNWQDGGVRSALKYPEGTVFAVPLGDGEFACGLVARANTNGVLAGYFFGPRRANAPGLGDVAHVRPEDAVLIGRFGHLGLRGGEWPILGTLPGWQRELWSLPPFVRYEELSGRTFLVFYSDLDPHQLLREIQVPAGPMEQGPKDGLMGAGFVELSLSALLT